MEESSTSGRCLRNPGSSTVRVYVEYMCGPPIRNAIVPFTMFRLTSASMPKSWGMIYTVNGSATRIELRLMNVKSHAGLYIHMEFCFGSPNVAAMVDAIILYVFLVTLKQKFVVFRKRCKNTKYR